MTFPVVEKDNYVKYVLLHLLIGFLVYVLPAISKVYAISIFVFGIQYNLSLKK